MITMYPREKQLLSIKSIVSHYPILSHFSILLLKHTTHNKGYKITASLLLTEKIYVQSVKSYLSDFHTKI